MVMNLVLADDHAIVLNGLVQLLSAEADIAILASCTDGAQALAAVQRHPPDILLLDLRMPVMDGLAVLRALRSEPLDTRVVILTAALDEDEVLEAIRLGVRGVVLKEMAPQLLLQCLRKVHAGGEWLEKRSVGRALEKMLQHKNEMHKVSKILTARELELLKLAATGLSNTEIAGCLFISEGTVKVHLHRIYEKLNLRNRVALTLYAKEKQLI